MIEKMYLETGRLEAFYDAVIAIIVTILVLELPQPVTPSLAAIWALRTSYFAYIISFLVCANLWQYHHMIYNHVNRIDTRIIWLNILLLFVVSLIPYLTTFISNNPNSLVSQVAYGLDYIFVDIILFITARELLKSNPENKEYLKETLNIKNSLIIPFTIFLLGFVIAFLGYPIAISFCCLFTIILSVKYSITH